MRNWNHPRSSFPFLHLPLPDYLWGIETIQVPGLSLAGSLASRLPMRNWNHSQHVFWAKGSHASRLPMRNWNDYLGRGTTEEDQASRLPMRNWNCSRCGLVVQQLWGLSFQTTYEELKLNSEEVNEWRSSQASRLPMRNWNCKRWWKRRPRLSLPDYLWGIETIENSNSTMRHLASRLPMRNWNCV